MDSSSGNLSAMQMRRAAWMLALAAVALGAMVFRLIQINTSMAPRLHALAAAQQESGYEVPARRGSILDARGRVLAGSRLRYSVFADPGLIEHPDEVARQLSAILDMPAGKIENEIRISAAPRFCWLKRCVDEAVADAVRALDCPGIGLRGEFERHWPMHTTAAHALGFVGRDGVGLEGLELLHDAHLRGIPGQRSTRRDARRRALGAGSDGFVDPQDGGHLILTIDSVVQTLVEQRLAAQVAEYEAESGVALVMAPRTGDILALACIPTFDVNRFAEYDTAVRRNRVVTDPVEPGSTFKPFVMAGALQRGFVRTDEQIDCHNGLHFFGRRPMHDTKPHGLLDVRGILVYSSNIGMGIIGERMGNPALRDTLVDLGFGAVTQAGLPGESEGILLPLDKWTSYSTTSVPMGQELAVTPLQLATAFCALVNRGVLLRPRIVQAKLAADYTEVTSFAEPEMIRRVLPESLSVYLTRDVLTGVVERGGKELDASPYRMSGKTGTAQVPYENRRGYEPDAYLSSFIGAAPADDPEIVVLVMIRKPNHRLGHYGRVVAGPAVRDIVRATLEYYQVPPDDQRIADAGH